MENFADNYLITIIISLVAFIAGSFVTWFFGKRYSSKKKMSCKIETYPIIVNEDLPVYENLEIRHNGSLITDLFKSTVTLINERPISVINKDDISSHRPLTCVCPDGEILKCVISKDYKKDEYGIKITGGKNNTERKIAFEYINGTDFIKLEVLHTKKELIVGGKIKGMKSEIPLKKDDDFSMNIRSYFLDVILISTFIVSIAVLIALENAGIFAPMFVLNSILASFAIGFVILIGFKVKTIYRHYKKRK